MSFAIPCQKYLRRIHPRCARDQNVLPRSRGDWFAKFPKFLLDRIMLKNIFPGRCSVIKFERVKLFHPSCLTSVEFFYRREESRAGMVRTDSDRVPATFKVMMPLFECRNNREHLGIICFVICFCRQRYHYSFRANTRDWLAKGMLFSFPFLFKAEAAHLVKRESEAVMPEYP